MKTQGLLHCVGDGRDTDWNTCFKKYWTAAVPLQKSIIEVRESEGSKSRAARVAARGFPSMTSAHTWGGGEVIEN